MIYEFREGCSAEEIFEAYLRSVPLPRSTELLPSWLEHPKETDSYLKEQDDRWEDFKARNPLSPGMIERFERAKRELPVKH